MTRLLACVVDGLGVACGSFEGGETKRFSFSASSGVASSGDDPTLCNDTRLEIEAREAERASDVSDVPLPEEAAATRPLNDVGGVMPDALALEVAGEVFDGKGRTVRFAIGAGAADETDSASLTDSGRRSPGGRFGTALACAEATEDSVVDDDVLRLWLRDG